MFSLKCFGSRRKHHQVTILCSDKIAEWFFSCSSLKTHSMLWRHINLLCRRAVQTNCTPAQQADMPP
jgi:hypothetical protein